MPRDLLSRIGSLYTALPSVPCQACGQCCVSPTCTLGEFIYLMRQCLDSMPSHDLRRAILTKPVTHPDYNGNLRCRFLQGAHCSIHPARTGACRLFGVPAVENMDIPDLVKCHHGGGVIAGRADGEFIATWLESLAALDAELYAFDSEPYFVTGFTAECWLDIYFDATLNFDVFVDIRRALRGNLDITALASEYTPATRVRGKIGKISLLSAMLGGGDAAGIREVLESIRDDYPLTGTWFMKEAEAYLRAVDEHGARTGAME